MELLEKIFFGLTTLLVLIGGVVTVAAKNPIRGAMGLLASILGIAGMYLLLAAELLAAIQVVVYAGAVVVLFLFVIMLIGPTTQETSDARGAVGRYFGAGAFAIVAIGALWVVMRIGGEKLTMMGPAPAGMGTVEMIGREMFSRQVVPFQISGVLLLIAVIGAMAVARGNQLPLVKVGSPALPPERQARPDSVIVRPSVDIAEGHAPDAPAADTKVKASP